MEGSTDCSTDAAGLVSTLYSAHRPQWFSLLDDFCVNEHFLIDADALVFQILGHHLDAPQSLHFNYVLESFLESLRNVNPNFKLVFFESHSEFWKQKNQHSGHLLRTILLDGSHGVPALHFESFWDESWAEYVRDSRPRFIFSADFSGIPGMSDGAETAAKLFRAHILHCLSQGVQTALLSELEFKEDMVWGFRCVPSA